MNATAQLCRGQIAARTGGGHGFAETTASYYDSSLRQTVTGLPDGTYATNVYFPTSQVKLNYGSRAYPTGTGFDAQNRMIKMTNWNSFAGGMVAGVTTWNYDANRGWLSSKVYDDGHGTAYTHTDAGRLNSRQWARGTNTSYHYNASGDLLSVVYNDNLTPAVFTGYDRRGRKTAAALVTNGFDEVQSATLAYNDAGDLLMESNSVGPLTGVAVVYSYDSYLRRTGVTVTTNGVAVAATGYGYDAASRLVLVSNGTFSATYSYLANSPLVGQIQFKSNTFTAVTTTKNYDALNRLTSIVSTPTGGSTQMPISYAYQYNAANQRTRATLYDNSYWLYGYDSLGQVTSGKKYWQDGTPVPGEQFGNAFDDIGNRTATTQGGDSHGGSLRTASYSVNDLNQYTSRTVPNAFDILGQANVAATVEVNGSTAGYRRGEFYQSLFTATNSSAPVWVTVTNTATNSGSYSNVIGNWFIPKTPENFTFDFDGNQTSDGRFTNYWDAENRLLTVSNIASIGTSGQFLVNFAYDYMGRRIQKVVYTNSGSSWIVSYTNKFVYDGWNLLAVLDGGNNLLQSFMWGLDLSGSMQGAGGVGGLLWMTIPSGANASTYFYCFDGNGNVGGLVNAYNGVIAALYEYDPFGCILRATGPMAFVNSIRFSTKYQDDETGWHYYGFRYLTDRGWLSRDPIAEDGGYNVYAFVLGNPVSFTDALGLTWEIFPRSPSYSRTPVRCDCNDTVADLAKMVKLELAEYTKWLKAEDGGTLPSSATARITTHGLFSVPNEAHITQGDLTPAPPIGDLERLVHPKKDALVQEYKKRGYKVIDDFTGTSEGEQYAAINNALGSPDIYVWAHYGHGARGSISIAMTDDQFTMYKASDFPSLQYKLSEVVMYSCQAGQGGWKSLVSQFGTLYATTDLIFVNPFWKGGPYYPLRPM